MVRILATGDFHLGKAISGAGKQSHVFREQLFRTAENIVNTIAPQNNSDLIVICGDLFDQHSAPWELIERTAEMLKKTEIPIHIIGGNHDPLEGSKETSLWKLDRLLKAESKVIIHKSREAYPINELGCTIYPGVLKSYCDNSDQVGWIPTKKKEDGFRIGLFHGSIRNYKTGTDEARMANLKPTLAVDNELDVALLGDWHQPKVEDGDSFYYPERKMWYTWAPEAQRLSDNRIGRVLICELSEGAQPSITPIEVGKNRFLNIEIEFDESTKEEILENLIETLSQQLASHSEYNVVVRVIASGWLSKSDYERLENDISDIKSKFGDVLFKDKVSILAEDLNKSENIIHQISETIGNSNDSKEIKELATKLLHKFAKQELGGA